MKHAGPQHRGDDAPQQHRVTRQHGEHGAVEQADQQRADGMDDGGEDQCTQAEVRDLRQGGIGPAGDSSSSQTDLPRTRCCGNG